MLQQLEIEIYFYTTPAAQTVFLSTPTPPFRGRSAFPKGSETISCTSSNDIKRFLVKPRKGHSNNTQGHWWEPMSLPVIFHLLVELTTVAGGLELGASSHVMSQTHARGL